MASRSALLGLGLACGLLIGGAAHAQIVHENPAQVKAANRRALRDAQHAESPYKDSHLGVTPARLRRGQNTQPQPEIRDELNYKNGTAPNVSPPGLFGLRRKKKR